jgi:hypothetical protein
MAEFVKIGRRRVRVADIRSIEEPATEAGDYLLVFTSGHVEPLSKADGEPLVAWADANLQSAPKQPKSQVRTA